MAMVGRVGHGAGWRQDENDDSMTSAGREGNLPLVIMRRRRDGQTEGSPDTASPGKLWDEKLFSRARNPRVINIDFGVLQKIDKGFFTMSRLMYLYACPYFSENKDFRL
ncbi:hypothetical protein CEXT_416331 [Caerostris extrusa]|uniref:Uncharacterized protein n=1 Tax=Caerostris extrusa TaxID=172846 RepID=A0AAV4XHC7_CAEEX|nr:hypothetical protein CEXT_416331 [Caerostris extrusa]